MNKFCGNCGAPLSEGAAFCGSCGTSARQASQPVSDQASAAGYQAVPQQAPQSAQAVPSTPPAFQPVAQPSASQSVVAAAPAAKSSNTWVKVLIVVLIVFFAVGAMAVGGVIYVAHKVSQKAQEIKHEVLGETSTAAADKSSGTVPAVAPTAGGDESSHVANPDDSASMPGGEACKLLSKEDVSSAIGITVVATAPADGGCSYFAKGTSVDMTAKHTAAMMGKRGADKKTQGVVEQFASIIGNSSPKNETNDNDRSDGTTAVLTFGIDTNEAEEQMKLNAKGLSFAGMGSIDVIDGIGDEAFAKADSMMFVRKGDKLIRIMYMTCPCATDAIKPLAKTIVDHL